MNTINTSYERLPQAEFVEKVEFIEFSLTGNANFPALPVDVATITAGRVAYVAKLDESKQGNHVATKEAEVLHSELNGKVKKNGIYINEVANDDEAILLSSGYDLTKEREYADIPEVRFVQGEAPGTGKIIIKAVKDAVAYLIFVSAVHIEYPVDEKTCSRLPLTTKHYQVISGLEPGKQYWLVYATVSVAGESVMSTPFAFRVI